MKYILNLSLLILLILISFNLFTSMIGIFLGIVIVWFYAINFLSKKDKMKIQIDKFFLFFIFWFLYALVQTIFFGVDSRTVSHLTSMLVGMVVIFLITKLIRKKDHLNILYNVWGFAAFLTVIVALWEIFTDNHLPQSGADFYSYSNVATVGFYNPNDYTYYLILTLPIIFYWFRKKGWYKLLALFMFISIFYISYMNEARFILLLFFIVSLTFLFSLLKRKKIKLLILFIFVGIITFLTFREELNEALDSIRTLNSSDESIGVREFLTRSALDIFKENPFGVGPGKAEIYMPKIGVGSSIHNFWLEIMVNYGIIIILLLFTFFIIVITKLIKTKNSELKTLTNPILVITLLFIPACIQSSSVFTFSFTWFIFGIMLSAYKILKSEEQLNQTLR